MLAGGLLGKVHKQAGAAPPGAHRQAVHTGVVIGCRQEHILCLHLFQQGVNQQHAGFDVGRNKNAALDHLGKPVSGVLKALVVPGEGAALDALLGFHGAVAGGKLEAVHGDVLLMGGINEFQHSVIAVFRQFGVVHGAAQIAQRCFGQHDGLAGQIGVTLNDIADGGACDQEEIHIPGIGAVGGVTVPVVTLFAAHVEITFSGVVVKVTNCLFGTAVQLDVERNVFVQGIGLLGIVAHGIAGGHVHVLFSLVDLAGFFAKAIEAVVGFDLGSVHAAVVGILTISKVGNICMQQAAIFIVYHDTEGCLFHNHLQAAALDHGLLVAIGQFGSGGLHALAAVLHQLVRAGVPGGHGQTVGRFIPIPIKTGADTQNIVRQKPDADLHRIGGNREAVFQLFDRTCRVANFHVQAPSLFCFMYLSVFLACLKITVAHFLLVSGHIEQKPPFLSP